MRWLGRRAWAASLVLLVLVGGAVTLLLNRPSQSPAKITSSTAAATFVDESACASCHADQVKAWHGSHHDLASRRTCMRDDGSISTPISASIIATRCTGRSHRRIGISCARSVTPPL